MRSCPATVPNQDHPVGVGVVRQHPPAVTVGRHVPSGAALVDLEAVGIAWSTDSAAVSVHTLYTSRPPGRTSAAPADQEPPLQRGQVVDVGRLDPPPGIGTTAERAEPAARCVDQHRVEAAGPERRRRSVGDDDGRRSCPSRATLATTRPAAVGRMSAATTWAPVAASAVALPPGAAHTSRTRSPGDAPTADATHCDDRSCT